MLILLLEQLLYIMPSFLCKYWLLHPGRKPNKSLFCADKCPAVAVNAVLGAEGG